MGLVGLSFGIGAGAAAAISAVSGDWRLRAMGLWLFLIWVITHATGDSPTSTWLDPLTTIATALFCIQARRISAQEYYAGVPRPDWLVLILICEACLAALYLTGSYFHPLSRWIVTNALYALEIGIVAYVSLQRVRAAGRV